MQSRIGGAACLPSAGEGGNHGATRHRRGEATPANHERGSNIYGGKLSINGREINRWITLDTN